MNRLKFKSNKQKIPTLKLSLNIRNVPLEYSDAYGFHFYYLIIFILTSSFMTYIETEGIVQKVS